MSITLEELECRLRELEAENTKMKKGATVKKVAPTIEFGCNLIEGAQIKSPNGDVDVSTKFGEVSSLSAEDITQMLKGSSTRTLFANGFLYFVDESNYERFSVKRKFNINREVIQSLVCSNNTALIEKFFNDVTKNKIDATMIHTIFYTIVVLSIDDDIREMRYETRKFIEEYFYGMKIEDASKLYKTLRSIEG